MRGVTKEQIIKSVLDASFYKGASKISLSDVASALGIKKASLYNHIESRDEMFASVFDYCELFLGKLKFIPDNIETVASRYSQETVLKGIMKRRFRMHQKPPLVQIYFFLQAQKYYTSRAHSILKVQDEHLASQIKTVLTALMHSGKVSCAESDLEVLSAWFCAGAEQLLCAMMIDLREALLANQEEGAVTVEIPPALVDGEDIERVSLLVERFCRLL